MDIYTAFLGVSLKEEIYLHPPQGYFYLSNIERSTKILVLQLRKSLYGSKQSSHVWYGTFRDFAILIGFKPSRVDGGVSILGDKKDECTVIAAIVLYIDDLFILATTDLIVDIKKPMQARFQMHVLGTVSFYLGMNIERNRDICPIDIHQHAYIMMIVEKFGMDKVKPVATPIATELHKLTPDEESCNQNL